MNRLRAAHTIGRGMRFHQGLGRLGDNGTYDPSQLPYIPTPVLSPVGTPAPVPVSAQTSQAIVQSSAWPAWGTYAAVGAGVLALIWLSNRRG